MKEDIVWSPREYQIELSNLTQILKKRGFATYDDFLKFSIEDPDLFWEQFFDDIGFHWFKKYSDTVDTSRSIAWARWFVGGKLNFTWNTLEKPIRNGFVNKIGLMWKGEEGKTRIFSYSELQREVNKLSNALLNLGLVKGDRVGLYMPMVPEVVFSFLAVSRIGGIVVPIFSGFGPEAISLRLNESSAKYLITTDGFRRRGKLINTLNIAREAVKDSPSIEKIIVVKRADLNVKLAKGEAFYEDLVEPASEKLDVPSFDSDTPFMIIFTSGTTGKPKGAVHVHGGFPIKATQDIFHLFDLKSGDIFFWLTDIGWMMGPWLIIGGLTLGSTILIYDGAPDYPGPDRLWGLLDSFRVSVAGISPTFIRHIQKFGDEWTKYYTLNQLRILGSTGEPWNLDPWKWTFLKMGGGEIPIINYSGGTEISGGILGCTVLRPIKPCSFNTVVPGVDADVFDESGRSVKGEPGYLVIKNSNPGMTRGFWNDPRRYEETYWSRFPGVWFHSDLALVKDGCWYILGRADDTLKVAGKRVGPAEIESVLVESGKVIEAAVIGIPDEIKGQVPIAFAVLRPRVEPDDNLRPELFEFVKSKLGKTLIPKEIYFVSDLPKTRNAKVMRRVIRSAFLGEDPGDLQALVNPETVEEIKRLGRS